MADRKTSVVPSSEFNSSQRSAVKTSTSVELLASLVCREGSARLSEVRPVRGGTLILFVNTNAPQDAKPCVLPLAEFSSHAVRMRLAAEVRG